MCRYPAGSNASRAPDWGPGGTRFFLDNPSPTPVGLPFSHSWLSPRFAFLKFCFSESALRSPPTKSYLLDAPTMNGTPTGSTPPICPTSLDPPESTSHPSSPTLRNKGLAFPFVKSAGDFHLETERNVVKPQPPGKDPMPRCHPANATAGIHFRHTTWAKNRARVHAALLPTDPDPLSWIRLRDDPALPDGDPAPLPGARALRFRECGSKSVVMQSVDDPNRYRIACERCHDRFCLPCMQDRARLIVANLKSQVPYEISRFMTLTLKHNDAPLKLQLDRLYASFSALRRRGFWHAMVTGGIAFLELKLSTSDGAWHPHLHVLLRGKYIPQGLLADAWLQVTGDSFIVDVRLVRSPEHLYSYLTRYVTKGWDSGMYHDQGKLREAISALRGRKLLCSFGDFAHLKLLLPPTPETWKSLGSLQEIISLAAQRVAWAMEVCTTIFAPGYEPPVTEIPPDDW